MSKNRRTAAAIAIGLTFASVLEAHDLFLKPENFFVSPNDSVRVSVLNGTFTSSEASVARDRLRDLSVAGAEGLVHPSTDSWNPADKASRWKVGVGKSGTYVLGASLLPRTIRLDAKEFNSYLQEDGLPDVLAERRTRGELGKGAHERYSKHVKSLIQVGPSRTEHVDRMFGYPAELVALVNPYKLNVGGTLSVRALVDGNPVSNQVILAGGRTRSGERIAEQAVRTDKDGRARIGLRRAGVWYVKFISMKRIDPAAGDSVDYESKWATLTFAVR
jgi:uncharacterized GH25 family protein